MRNVLSNTAPEFQGAMLRALRETGEMSIGALRALTPFTENAQKVIDTAVVKVGLERLAVAKEILSEGLIYSLPNPLSVMEVQWDQQSKAGGAIRVMNPKARGENGLLDRRPKRIPVYITMDDFNIGVRSFQMSQRIGTPIDVSLVEEATRRVNEAIEDATINGAGVQVDGYSTYGILTAPNANTSTLTATWVTTTGDNIVSDTLVMIGKLQADKKFGPYTLFVGTTVSNHLNTDFKANGTLTIKQRLEQIEAGGRNLKIVVADQMPATTVVLMQMTSDVVDMISGQSPTVVPWTSPDGFTLYWAVMAIMVPRVRDDYDGNSGIVIGTP